MPRRGKEEGIGLPKEIQALLDRDPIILGRESVGTHFINMEEIADVRTAIAFMQVRAKRRGQKVLSFGLTGSRIQGRFYYTPEELMAKKLMPYAAHGVDLEEYDRAMYSYDGRIPLKFFQRLKAFADYLREQQELRPNLSEIDFASAPELIRKFTQFDMLSGLPLLLVPQSALASGETIRTPHPAFFYPDIDLVGITATALRGDNTIGDWLVVGGESGTAIQMATIAPSHRYPHGMEGIKEGILANFRPFVNVW